MFEFRGNQLDRKAISGRIKCGLRGCISLIDVAKCLPGMCIILPFGLRAKFAIHYVCSDLCVLVGPRRGDIAGNMTVANFTKRTLRQDVAIFLSQPLFAKKNRLI